MVPSKNHIDGTAVQAAMAGLIKQGEPFPLSERAGRTSSLPSMTNPGINHRLGMLCLPPINKLSMATGMLTLPLSDSGVCTRFAVRLQAI